MGFEAGEAPGLAPGKTVEVFASSNKRGDVLYSWEAPGTWRVVGQGRIEWTIPQEPGEYNVTVTAIDQPSGMIAKRSSLVTVAEGGALAAPESFSCVVKTSTQFTNKLIGSNVVSDTSVIRMNADGSVEVATTTPAGETIRTVSDADSFYAVAPDGSRKLLARDTGGLEGLPPRASLVSLAELKAACPDWTSDGRMYTFTQSSASARGRVVFDALLGVVTRMRVESEDGLEVQDISVDYETIEGYLIPKRVEGTIEYVAGDEPYSIHIVQEMEDIEVNADPVTEQPEDSALASE